MLRKITAGKIKCFLALLLLFAAICANAQQQIRDKAEEKIIEDQLKAINPSLVEPFKAATIALDSVQYKLADSLYTIVYRKAPGFDVVMRRLGGVKVALEQRNEAILLCEKAIKINRSAFNLLALANCLSMAGTKGEVYVNDLNKAYELVIEGQMLPDGDDDDFPVLLAQISYQLNDITKFREATEALIKKCPGNKYAHYFAAVLAAHDKNLPEAEQEINKAQSLGLSGKDAEEFLDAYVHPYETVQGTETFSHSVDKEGAYDDFQKQHRAYNPFYFYFFLVIILWVLGLILLFMSGEILSQLTLRSLKRNIQLNNHMLTTRFLRITYRILIFIGSVYYYISLPVIIVLVLSLVALVIYASYMAGRIPVYIVLMLVVGAAVTIYSTIHSIFVKRNYKEPGRELKEEEAPELYKLTTEVAGIMKTRKIDEIRITVKTDLAVYERGSWSEKLSRKARRILILGVGVVRDFKQSDFRSVLAHEYGHFSHRDTAGGEIAFRVKNDMFIYYQTLFNSRQAVWWNIAFQFLRTYNIIFIRITHGSTRLQEVLADRVAAQTFGEPAFENGLKHVIRREIEFETLANIEIDNAREFKRPLNNIYELSEGSVDIIEEAYFKVINEKTSENNTHPGFTDRLKFIKGLGPITGNNDNSYVSDLFKDWNSLTKEMTDTVQERINK
jgi:tetratricopeptide (TPR) repeat protein